MILLVLFLLLLLFFLFYDRSCGITSNGVVSYCKPFFFNMDHHVNGINTGKKWECVEFVRRYYQQIHQLTFLPVENARDMRHVREMRHLQNNFTYPCVFYPPSNSLPAVDDILLFNFEQTGHTAIVVKMVDANHVQIAEQNWSMWEHPHYSRVISLSDPTLIGWIHVQNLGLV